MGLLSPGCCLSILASLESLLCPGYSLCAQGWHWESRPWKRREESWSAVRFWISCSCSPGELASCPHQLQPSASHANSLLGRPDCFAPSDLFCVILLNPLEGDEGREFFVFVHVALVERRPLQCPFAFELVTRGS